MLRDGGDLVRTRRLGRARFERQVRAEVVRRGRIKPCLRILNKLWAALVDPAGVEAHRAGGFERISWILDDWEAARANQTQVEQHMTEALDQLGLTQLVTSIDGLSPVGAASILAETATTPSYAAVSAGDSFATGAWCPGSAALVALVRWCCHASTLRPWQACLV